MSLRHRRNLRAWTRYLRWHKPWRLVAPLWEKAGPLAGAPMGARMKADNSGWMACK